jgi:threonine dehydrogenase-like Zn-dependent dehydrogenase
MRAVVVTPKQPKSAKLADMPEPKRQRGEALVRVLEVGIDGTDRDIDAGRYGEAPRGEKGLILGHESLGEIVEGAGKFKPGDLVVATVRRPCPERCHPCAKKTYDFCSSGNYEERGIKARHGYLAEWYTEQPEFLIPIPKRLRKIAVLLEPMSIVEKAFRQVDKIQERLPWQPTRVLITGAGGIGTLAACVSRLRGFETVVYSRSALKGAGHAIRAELGVRDVDAEASKLPEIHPDIVIEATGSSQFAWDAARALAVNGVVCLLSVTGGKNHLDIAADELNDDMVLGNKLMFGSVNSHRMDFEQGVKDFGKLTGVLDRFITRRLPLAQIRAALERQPGDLKTVVEIQASEAAH